MVHAIFTKVLWGLRTDLLLSFVEDILLFDLWLPINLLVKFLVIILFLNFAHAFHVALKHIFDLRQLIAVIEINFRSVVPAFLLDLDLPLKFMEHAFVRAFGPLHLMVPLLYN